MLTQQRLKEVLQYSPETGKFTWLVSTSNVRTKGSVAGGITSGGYWAVQIDGIKYPAGHLAFLYVTGDLPTGEVDHIDRVKCNNAWNNLRVATRSQNNQNTKVRKDSSSGIKGVSFVTHTSKWMVSVKSPNGYYCECFPTIEQASDMAARMRTILHGDFAV